MPDRGISGISAQGKFLWRGKEKFYVRGVTYGTFRPQENGDCFPLPEIAARDFSDMAAAGINCVRVYTPPPAWLLDLAGQHGLYVMVGLPWEQHIAFLDEPERAGAIEERVRSAVRELGNHPAILCYVVGNEIPASIVRWHGAPRIEQFIRRLYLAVKSEAPEKLVTYVNFPTTEYLRLPFLDFFCFNVYLEEQGKLEAYIAQLQNHAGDRPLLLAEVGLDSIRNGEAAQGATLTWQIRTIFAGGCAGVFVFAWTDEWFRGGHDIEDWDFGLTRRDRRPKPALQAVSAAFAEAPFPKDIPWPLISVVVCTHNGSRTIRDCLEGLAQLEYPAREVTVVDDGSTDGGDRICEEFDVRLIRIPHAGLGVARNVGTQAANGEIVAYIDDDARPDPHWLHYLAWTYLHTGCAAAGGPNIAPPSDGLFADAVANAPGGPVHVLVTDSEAEHIPGCNSSFRKDKLIEAGGFDPRFRAAGDDVDVCWKFLERGWKIAFHAGAMVWHHRRSTLRGYWSQQAGYGRAEALLEAKWPAKYNSAGSVEWSGRLYGQGALQSFGQGRIYQGVWGTAAFQRLYSGHFNAPILTLDWHLAALLFGGILLAASAGSALLFAAAVPVFIFLMSRMVRLGKSLSDASFVHDGSGVRFLTAGLHILQPVARFWGRTAQEAMKPNPYGFPLRVSELRRRVLRIWSEEWKAPEQWLQLVEATLRAEELRVRRGGDFDAWDLEMRSGPAGIARLKLAVEEHGAGKQMLLFEVRPRAARFAALAFVLFAALSLLSFATQHPWSGAFAAALGVVTAACIVTDCCSAATSFHVSVESLSRQRQAPHENVVKIVYLGSS